MASVVLDVAEFRIWYPGLTEEVISDVLLEVLWDQAVALVGNTDKSSFAPYNPPEVKDRKYLLYYALCHLATLSTLPMQQTGRVQSASEGSVSTSFDLIKGNSTSEQWWLQTRCGAQYWMMTARYRLGGRMFGQKQYHPWG